MHSSTEKSIADAISIEAEVSLEKYEWKSTNEIPGVPPLLLCGNFLT